MAVKVSSTTVIDDSRGFFPQDITGTYSNFHPTLNINTSSVISFANTAQSITMTADRTYSTTGLAAGRQLTFSLDRSTSGYTPTFGSEVEFAGGTPTWSNRRHWLISFTCWSSSVIRATALGFNEPGTVSSSMDSSFNTLGFNSFQNDFGTSFEQAWCYMSFKRDDSNNRIILEMAGGDTTAMATVTTVYVNYTGISTITSVEAQYNGTFSASGTTNQATWGPRPEDDGYASGTYYTIPSTPGYLQFGWMAANNPNFSSSSGVNGGFTAPAFRIKLVAAEGTFYSTGTKSGVTLSAYYGNQAQL